MVDSDSNPTSENETTIEQADAAEPQPVSIDAEPAAEAPSADEPADASSDAERDGGADADAEGAADAVAGAAAASDDDGDREDAAEGSADAKTDDAETDGAEVSETATGTSSETAAEATADDAAEADTDAADAEAVSDADAAVAESGADSEAAADAEAEAGADADAAAEARLTGGDAEAGADADADAAAEAGPAGGDAESAADSDDTAADSADGTADGTADDTDAPARDPRIPEVITARTLFFLAPDIPPLPERPRFRREEEPEAREERDSEETDDRPRGRGRSRRGRRGGAAREPQDRQPQVDEPEVEPEPITEPQKLHGSTRLAAKRQRRRDGRDIGRRRTIVTESEFQARREAVDRKMLVRAKNNRVQIGVLEDNVLVEHYVARNEDSSLIGNVYLGRVQNVLPSMEAAFVDIGRARNAVLYSGEVDWAAAEMGANTPRKIENALKPGDRVLVQVTKDPIGHKGARLTSQVSLPGRYLVYVPGNTMNGISRKLPDTERNRLKKILKEVLPPGVGVIVRTAAEGATKEQLQRDVERLTQQWEDIQQKAKGGKAPQTLHAEPDMLIKIIRDVFNEDFQQLIIQGQSELDTIKHYLGQVAPDLLERVQRYDGDGDVFADYRADEMIDKALARKVWLPSGGSLVIDRTEAMTVVDVNTGKFVGSGGNLEETVTKNNLEAAEEVVRQLRLRDIGGIIVIDFIDMVLESNRDLVLRRLVECLSRDRTKHQVAEVTSLGLIQMTRKKIGLGLLETFSTQCDSCDGRGVHVHAEPVSQGSGGGRSSRSRRGRGGQDGGGQQRQQQKPQSKPANGNGTHEITDDARNALTKIAASTISSAVKADAESPAIEGAAERLAIAAAAAAAGKSGEQVVAAVESADAGRAQDADARAGDDHGSRDEEGGSRRSRRGRRGRGRGRGDGSGPQDAAARQDDSTRQDDTARQAESARRDDSGERAQDARAEAEASAAAPREASEAEQSRSGSRRSRRVSAPQGTPEPQEQPERPAVRIELPEPKRERERPASAPTASLGDLDAALDSLAGERGEAREEARPASGRRSRGARRRITTGPIRTDDSE